LLGRKERKKREEKKKNFTAPHTSLTCTTQIKVKVALYMIHTLHKLDMQNPCSRFFFFFFFFLFPSLASLFLFFSSCATLSRFNYLFISFFLSYY